MTARFAAWWDDYWYEAVPMRRLAAFSRIIHGTVIFSILFLDTWVPGHGWAPRSFWRPVGVARALSIPAPTPTTMVVLRVVIIAAATVAILLARPVLDGRLTRGARVANTVVFLSYGMWLVWAFSWSKVDHDRLTIMFVLGVLAAVPGVGDGPSRLAGWALRSIQVVFLLAYPLSAVSKIQKTGWDWANKATFARAVIRRGTDLGSFLADHGELLRVGQWAFIGLEFVSIVALCRNTRVRAVIWVGLMFLHLFTWLAIGIHFLPHSICLLAFLPLERFRLPGLRRPTVRPETVTP